MRIAAPADPTTPATAVMDIFAVANANGLGFPKQHGAMEVAPQGVQASDPTPRGLLH